MGRSRSRQMSKRYSSAATEPLSSRLCTGRRGAEDDGAEAAGQAACPPSQEHQDSSWARAPSPECAQVGVLAVVPDWVALGQITVSAVRGRAVASKPRRGLSGKEATVQEPPLRAVDDDPTPGPLLWPPPTLGGVSVTASARPEATAARRTTRERDNPAAATSCFAVRAARAGLHQRDGNQLRAVLAQRLDSATCHRLTPPKTAWPTARRG